MQSFGERVSCPTWSTMVFLCGIAFSGLALADEPKTLALDEFENELALKWQPLRADATAVSLKEKPGTLTIMTQSGSLGRIANRVPAKNLYLIDNPVREGGDFVVTTCIVGFKPSQKWQQAGLLIYDDDDHYLKNDMEFSGTATRFKFIREWRAEQKIYTDQAVPKSDRIWIRIVKRGNVYERLYSVDGKEFRTAGERTWGNGSPLMLGLIAMNGPTNADPIAASFDFFEVRELTENEANDPRKLAREKLQGDWKVVSSEHEGQSLTNAPFSEFSFRDGRLSLVENGNVIEGEYELDMRTDPDSFKLLDSGFSTTKTANGIFKLEDEKLWICLSLKEKGRMPLEFKTHQGDKCLLLQLEREN